MLRFFYLVFFLALSFFTELGYAEFLHLKNGAIVEGTLQKFEANAFTFTLKDGSVKTFLKEDVKNLDLTNPLAAASPLANTSSLAPLPLEKLGPYDTPTQTFQTWRIAAISDDMDAMVNCYSKFKQKQIRNDLKKISKAKRKEMQEAVLQTQFFPNDPYYQGDKANLEVTWQKGLESDVQILQFILEGKNWKIIQ